MRYLASVFAWVRCQEAESQVWPISHLRFLRSIFQKRVDPMAFPVATSSVTNGSAVPSARSSRAEAM
jgi:hypothetical protein